MVSNKSGGAKIGPPPPPLAFPRACCLLAGSDDWPRTCLTLALCPPAWRVQGKRNIDATLLHLAREHGLGAAANIMQTGASAGGLAAYLHADYVHDFLTRTPAGTG